MSPRSASDTVVFDDVIDNKYNELLGVVCHDSSCEMQDVSGRGSLHKICSSAEYSQDGIYSLPNTNIVQSSPIGILFPEKKKNRSITFADPIVTEVRLRPRTKQKNKHKLFFTPQEYFMFRKEYRAYKEELRREKSKSSSPLYLALSYASSFISGLEVRQRASSSSSDVITTSAVEQSDVTTSDLYDVLYLY